MKPDPHGEVIIEEFLASQRDGDAYLRPHVRTTAYVEFAAIIARALLEAHQRGRQEGTEEAVALLRDHATISNGETLDPAIPEILKALYQKADDHRSDDDELIWTARQ